MLQAQIAIDSFVGTRCMDRDCNMDTNGLPAQLFFALVRWCLLRLLLNCACALELR